MSIRAVDKGRRAVVFPKYRQALEQLGENFKLARKRRNLTQALIAGRTGLSRITIRKIENGDPTVSIGHYVSALGVLGLAEDFATVAMDDEFGRKLLDIQLLKRKSES